MAKKLSRSSKAAKFVYFFGGGKAEGKGLSKNVLGGKGQGNHDSLLGKSAALHPELGIKDNGWVEVTGTDLKPGEPVITHCQSGGRASVDAFVMERLGFPPRNYYLGWSDWGNTDETPVETGK